MEANDLILFLKERLRENYVTSKVEKLNIPVISKDMCVVLKKTVVTCNVNDEAMALTALWRFATEDISCLFVSTRRNTPTLLKDMFEEVFGLSIDDIDLRKSSSLAGFDSFLDDFSKNLKSATYRVSWEFTCKTTKILLLYIFLGHNRNVVNTKFPYPIKRLEVIRRFNQKSMAFNQSLS